MTSPPAPPSTGPPPGLLPSRHPGWPAILGPVTTPAGELGLRPLHRRDGPHWQQIRTRDEKFIAPWDATSRLSWPDRHTRPMWRTHRASLAAAARRGEVVPFAIVVDGAFAGQVTLGGIQRGALSSAWVGYWVDSALHGRGVATTAVALTIGHAFGPVGLHRIEATIAPENIASIAVVEHLGLRREGYLERYLEVGTGWHDHLLFAVTAEEVPGGTADLLGRHRSRPDHAG